MFKKIVKSKPKHEKSLDLYALDIIYIKNLTKYVSFRDIIEIEDNCNYTAKINYNIIMTNNIIENYY